MNVVGIDAGKKGGICVLSNSGDVVAYERTPTIGGEYDLAAMTALAKTWRGWGATVWLESCQAFPKIGARTNFEVGRGYGLWLGILAAIGVSHQTVRPAKWHKRLCSATHLKNKKPKAKALLVARQLWPDEDFVPGRCKKAHDGVIDAALIAEYGRRERSGND